MEEEEEEEESFVEADILDEHKFTTHFINQNLDKLDITKLHALDPDVLKHQATINLGMVGHVAHGKSSTVRSITGINTVRFKAEQVRNITIKLGYANAKIYKCPTCPRPHCYQSLGSATADNPKCQNENCDSILELLRHVSFCDCPGHEILMSNLLAGTSVMDSAFLLVSAAEPAPQPQTAEHLAALEMLKLKDIIILQNKVDLVSPEKLQENHKQIKEFVKGTSAEKSLIIPISAQHKYNIGVVLEYIVKKIPIPTRDFISPPQMTIIRSFDVNKPGTLSKDLVGGVVGGSITKGVLKLNDRVEIRPGIVKQDHLGNIKCIPIRTKVVSIFAEKNDLQYAVPGGLIGVGTKIDPTLCRADHIVGQVLGIPGHLPDIYIQIEINYFLLNRLLGVKTTNNETSSVNDLEKGESLMANIGSTSIPCTVLGTKVDLCKLKLSLPVCTSPSEKVALSRRIDRHWRLIGWGKILRGKTIPVDE